MLLLPFAGIFRLDRPNEQVSPEPPPTTLPSPTLPAKLLREETVMLEVAVAPAKTATVPGLAETEKLGRGTVKLKVTVTACVRLPLVPVTFTGKRPSKLPVHVSVEVPEPPVTVPGLKLQDRLEELVWFVKTTSLVKLWNEVMVIVEEPATPTFVETLVGLAEIPKSGPTLTRIVRVGLVLTLLPEVALIVAW